MTVTAVPKSSTTIPQRNPNITPHQRVVDLGPGAWPARWALQRYEEYLISADNYGGGWCSYLNGTINGYRAGARNVEVVDGVEYVADGTHDETGWRVPVAVDWVTVGFYDEYPFGAVR